MTLNQLICRAASAYPEALILNYWDLQKEQPKSNINTDDILAEFIANELYSTFKEDASDEQQLAEAVSVMQSAADDLQAIAHALANIDREREYEREAA